ncbi:MAG: DnaJ domain-containing protein [Elusimicrobia bacterium]|nr:DnaJ domain-containing protein [Elusimicrobiota bacterium]
MSSIVALLIVGFIGYLLGALLRRLWPIGVIVALLLTPVVYDFMVTPSAWFTLPAAGLAGMVVGGFKREVLPAAVNLFYWLHNRWELRAWERRQARREREDAAAGGDPWHAGEPRPERRRYEPAPEAERERGAAGGAWARWGRRIAAEVVGRAVGRRRSLKDEMRDARRETEMLREELELQRQEREAERDRSRQAVAEERERVRQERAAMEEARRRQAQASTDRGDPYAVLGVRREATLEQIKRVYRALAKAYHEDVAAGVAVPGRMADLNRAMEAIERSRRG